MGIPKMFRFLTDRYPLIMQRLDEDHTFDNFYLDMNGIIHQCTHPSDSEIPFEDFDTMISRILHYTERLYRIVLPTNLMFLAVDGVAPRAKMNQQRSRRFRSAKDAERTMAEAIARGDVDPAAISAGSKRRFDSNCITPGTQFMYDLSLRFRQWIDEKMSTDVAFQQGCTIVFSGPEVPGEGEHKIMDHIRAWKDSPDFDPTVRHCMYGLDADLMMLGLVAHVPFFTLLRERLRFSKAGRVVPKMSGTSRDAEEFQLLEIAMLRDMLFLEFKRGPDEDPMQRPSPKTLSNSSQNRTNIQFSSRRVVDDFVFMCMLVGNDFIPNLPHLDISDGAINDMFSIYKRMVPKWGGYLTDRHRLHPDRLESFLGELAQTELQYFHNRARTDGVPEYQGPGYRRAYYRLKFKLDIGGDESGDPSGSNLQRTKTNDEAQLFRLRQIYLEGLHWVLQYYHNGVSSWNWFYPQFYAVLASDMHNLRAIKVAFKRGKPFRPLTQLMAVLPPESSQFLPAPMRELMINPRSPVADMYPAEFDIDLNGKRNDWEAVVVVPFIDEKRLLTEVNAIDRNTQFTEAERLRDQNGSENWFHGHKYPRSEAFVRPVRPSKFSLPKRSRSSSSSSSSNSSYSNSPSRRQNQRGTTSRNRERNPSGSSADQDRSHNSNYSPTGSRQQRNTSTNADRRPAPQDRKPRLNAPTNSTNSSSGSRNSSPRGSTTRGKTDGRRTPSQSTESSSDSQQIKPRNPNPNDQSDS